MTGDEGAWKMKTEIRLLTYRDLAYALVYVDYEVVACVLGYVLDYVLGYAPVYSSIYSPTYTVVYSPAYAPFTNVQIFGYGNANW